MIKEVVKVKFPVDESLLIRKNRFEGDNTSDGKKKRISIVTGVHGDELEGQYVAFLLGKILSEHPECLTGIVDIYPAMNPLGIDSVTRGIPAFDLDMNRIFPGRSDGDMNEYVASKIISDLEGSDLVLDIHASNIYLTEIPQIRINEITRDVLMPYALESNVDFVWVHSNSTVLESTLAYSLNEKNTPTLVVEMGVGMRITKEYGKQLVDGILNLMNYLGIWKQKPDNIRKPIVAEVDTEVCFLNAPKSGVFVKNIDHGTFVKQGDLIGEVVDPLKGNVSYSVIAPVDGLLFTIREYPMVSEGSLMGRILVASESGGKN